MWLGQTDPRDAMAETRASDPKRLVLAKVLIGINAAFGKQPQSVGSIYAIAKDGQEASAKADLWAAIEEITMKARDDRGARIMFGRWLESQKGRVVGGLRLDGERNPHTKAMAWRVTDLRVVAGSGG